MKNTDELGRTDLMNACIDGDFSIVQRLLSEKNDVNIVDINQLSALHFAVQSGSIDIVEKLIEAKAQIDAVDSNGNSPLSDAVFNYRGDGGIVELLQRSGADSNLKNLHGVSPKDLAISIDNYDVKKYFD